MKNNLGDKRSIFEIENRPVHLNDPHFVDHYAEKTLQPDTIRAQKERMALLRKFLTLLSPKERVWVADVGCGPGSAALVWASEGFQVVAVDISEPLLALAKQRAEASQLSLYFCAGSATDLPLQDQSFDLCLVPELLEHVSNWQQCLDEFSRVLKQNGVLFVSTSNKMCPKQQEFNLPLYSWYPSYLKKYFEKKALTSWPEIANHATHPAVNWFTYFELRNALKERGFKLVADRFDVGAKFHTNTIKKMVAKIIVTFPVLRWVSYIFFEGVTLVAVKR